MINRNAAFDQNFFKITVRHGVAKLGEYCLQDHRLRKCSSALSSDSRRSLAGQTDMIVSHLMV